MFGTAKEKPTPPSGRARIKEKLRVCAVKFNIAGYCRDAGSDPSTVENFIYKGGTLSDKVLDNFARLLLHCSYDPATDTLTSLWPQKVLPTLPTVSVAERIAHLRATLPKVPVSPEMYMPDTFPNTYPNGSQPTKPSR